MRKWALQCWVGYLITRKPDPTRNIADGYFLQLPKTRFTLLDPIPTNLLLNPALFYTCIYFELLSWFTKVRYYHIDIIFLPGDNTIMDNSTENFLLSECPNFTDETNQWLQNVSFWVEGLLSCFFAILGFLGNVGSSFILSGKGRCFE